MVGRLLRNIREHDRIVGGIDEASTQRATELYSPVLTTGKVIPMTATAAEVTKTAENTFRDLQIAAINELALYCEAMGINVYDVRTGIDSLKGEGITRALLWPGAGVGGHCLTKDTYHLERGVQMLGKGSLDYPAGEPSLYVLARHINDFMPTHMFRLTMDGLERAGVPPKGAKVAMLGWAFLSDYSMAAHFMKTRKIDAVIVGADRITGDAVFNKIGTYMHAVLARYHKIPFYVAAPLSTFDVQRTEGDVVIEERGRGEIARIGNRTFVPPAVPVMNPAFDATPLDLVSAIITDKGIIRPPFTVTDLAAGRTK